MFLVVQEMQHNRLSLSVPRSHTHYYFHWISPTPHPPPPSPSEVMCAHGNQRLVLIRFVGREKDSQLGVLKQRITVN